MESRCQSRQGESLAACACRVPDLPGLSGLNVGDCALEKVDVEAQKVHVIHCFKLDWIAEKVVVDECLDGWVGEEMFVVDDEAIVHIAVIGEV